MFQKLSVSIFTTHRKFDYIIPYLLDLHMRLGLTFVMLIRPIRQTNIAKIMTAATCHVIATLNAFDECLAFGATFPVFEFVLKIYIAWTLMPRKFALSAKYYSAFMTVHSAFGKVDNSFAISSRA